MAATPSTETLVATPSDVTAAGAARLDAPVTLLRRPRPGTLRALLRHSPGMVGLVGLVVMVAVAVIGPRLLAYGPTDVDILNKLAPPTPAHPLGSDYLGRDVLSRIVDAAHRSLGTAAIVVVCIFWTVLAANLLGDALRDILDPSWKHSR